MLAVVVAALFVAAVAGQSCVWPSKIANPVGCLKSATYKRDQVFCSGHRQQHTMRVAPNFSAAKAGVIPIGTVVTRVHGACEGADSGVCEVTSVGGVKCVVDGDRCTLPLVTYRRLVYVYAQSSAGTGWVVAQDKLVPLQALGAGATADVCRKGDALPMCQRTAVLEAGGWPNSLHARALCVMKGESGGNRFAMGPNLGSVDIGLMQINNKFQACAACDMDPSQSLCGVYCWELVDPVKNAECAKKVYDCSRNGFLPWYAYNKNKCSQATSIVIACDISTLGAEPLDPVPPIPGDALPPGVKPEDCPPSIDCYRLSEECLAKHSLAELSDVSFHLNPPRECLPQTDDECGVLCGTPPSAQISGKCQAAFGSKTFAGDCMPAQACINSGLSYVKNGQCPGRDACCVQVECVSPNYVATDEANDDLTIGNSQCAHVDYCKAKKGQSFPSTSAYKSACSAHSSRLVQCCEFPPGVTHTAWTGSFQAYREDDSQTLLENDAAQRSTSLVMIAAIAAVVRAVAL